MNRQTIKMPIKFNNITKALPISSVKYTTLLTKLSKILK